MFSGTCGCIFETYFANGNEAYGLGDGVSMDVEWVFHDGFGH